MAYSQESKSSVQNDNQRRDSILRRAKYTHACDLFLKMRQPLLETLRLNEILATPTNCNTGQNNTQPNCCNPSTNSDRSMTPPSLASKNRTLWSKRLIAQIPL